MNFEGIVSFIEQQSRLTSMKSIKRWAERYMSEHDCKSCNGSRLNIESSHFRVAKKGIDEVSNMDISSFLDWTVTIEQSLNKNELKIAKQ